MRLPWTKRLVPIPVVLLLLGACGSDEPEPTEDQADGDQAQDSDTGTGPGASHSIEEVCQLAVDEGVLAMWGGSDEEVAQAFFDVFAESYPGIEYEYLSVRPSEGAQRLITEAAAGQAPAVDLISFEPNTVVGLIERDMIDLDVDWEALGVTPELVTAQNAVLWSRNGQGITYNTDQVSADELPDTWEGLIDPRWADGQIIVDPRGRPFDKLSLVWGEEEALDYVRRLKEINPAIIEGGTAGMVAVAGGEAVITTGGLTVETAEQQAVGAPLEIKYLDVITTEDAIVSALADAPHPNAATCYASWLASDEGQQAVQEINFGGATLEGLPADSVVRSIETPEEAQAVADMSTAIAEIWTDG